jgi:hypothetical protein
MEFLVDVLAAAGEICLAAGNWFYPGDRQSSIKMAVGCLAVFSGLALIALLAVIWWATS